MEDLKTVVMQWGQEGFCCSQVMILAGLALTGKENEDLTAAMNGLCRGTFSPGCTWGIDRRLLPLGFYAGKGAPWEERSETARDDRPASRMVSRKMGRGRARQLRNILGYEPITDPKQCFQKCFPMIMETLEKALELLETHGFDIREGRLL